MFRPLWRFTCRNQDFQQKHLLKPQFWWWFWDLRSRSFYISHVQDPVFYLSAAKKHKEQKGNWFVFDLISAIKCWSKSWRMNLKNLNKIRPEIKLVLCQQILWKDQNQRCLTSCLSLSAPRSSQRCKSWKTPQKYFVFIFRKQAKWFLTREETGLLSAVD